MIRRAGIAGFSLVELMIALTLGLVALAAVGSVFQSSARGYRQDDRLSRLQDELRFAMAQLTLDLEMAGFFAQVRDPAAEIEVDPRVSIARDCGPPPASGTWVYHEQGAALFTIGDASAAAAHAAFPCLAAGEFVAGTDVLAVKRLDRPVAGALDADRIYFKTNGVRSAIFRGADLADVEPRTGSLALYELRPSVWFVRKYAFAGQDPPVPSLCRRRLAAGTPPSMDVECLAQGIENLQVEFGVDADADGVPDEFREYTAPPAHAEMRRVVALRVHLLARSTEADPDYRTVKTFRLASQRITGTGAYYRKSLSSTVLLRNVAHRLVPLELPQ